MSDYLDSFYFFISGAALLLAVLGIWFTAVMPGTDRWSKRFFLCFFGVIALCCFLSFVELALYFYPSPAAAIRVVVILECLLFLLPTPMLTFFLLYCCGEALRESPLLRAALSLWALYAALVISGLFHDAFFFFAADRTLYRGPWYPLLPLPVLAINLLNLIVVIRRRERLSKKTFLSFLIALLPLTVTLPVHMFVDILPLIDISITLSALSMYSLILSDQIEQDLRRQREIAHQRASIMILQMRPHFIYNTMTSIYCLCSQDPEKARQVVLDFTTYLRKNFTAIVSAEPIPFTSELEHARAYLAAEQAQYEDSLLVEYDTPHTFFRVPPLTLQPIVENAVKHGWDPDAAPLSVSVRTRKTDAGSEITVSDNGRGYDPADDSEPHIALKNIGQRLEIMCGGSLTIRPNEGGGTVVTVMVPDSAAKETTL